MIRIFPDQLKAQLQKYLRPCYLLLGRDLLLLQESQDHIYTKAQSLNFQENYNVVLDEVTNWDAIFSFSKELSLFAHRKILLVTLPDNGLTVNIGKKLIMLTSLLHRDLLLILRIYQLTSSHEKSVWFNVLTNHNGVLVDCSTPETAHLPLWVNKRANKMQLSLDNAACELLCHNYENNLTALVQTLEHLKLIYPDGILTLSRIEDAVNDVSHFTHFHWINAILSGNSKRAHHILQQLKNEAMEPIMLLYYLQKEIFLLLTLKRKATSNTLSKLFDQHKISTFRRKGFIRAIQRLNIQQLYQAIALMLKIELILKQDYIDNVWADINALSQLLCGNQLLPALMIHG
ncbi:DNA polymerase III subunit delta [Candidatus Palibaumannia cicadellinicola]|uniref:DNA polymerase III subunit delta n=1 Tax=Baumannia cicadellinicola subsp. Homalodisca coagulata TaxID=374463 RepID=Q1LTM8_BAUCH|nr:DNA polymerase III subunit delta [Candidatus Baumannia cicadellinicola]ABF14265.1 DNA-directed DNA polymerase delta chain [Baumannia cicadellinicola str. Hc (Homalodisca coagulata)]MCJ7462331.1 DNA polymerase III subunit delta [Candidatus Baumannia cicadellinicola]MCJ7462637.1 DNA polymerase III subunit delta [Candidatus Baumannia cicadellinicola]